jgi:homoserine trans-succinylase
MIGFSPVMNIQVRLPAGNENTSLLNILVQIRDTYDCITEYNISSVSVIPDTIEMNDLINILQDSTNEKINNQFIQELSSRDQNTVGQILTSFSNHVNKISDETLDNAISCK